MSAPNTNTEKQARQHRGPLRGMLGVVLFAIVLLALLAIFVFNRGGTPRDASTVDGRTGAAAGAPEAVENDAAPLVQPEAVTGADASADEAPDATPSDTAVSEPVGEGGDGTTEGTAPDVGD